MKKSMSKKKFGGFTCHSPAATAVCMTGPDSRSVIIPGRRSSAERNIITHCSTNDNNFHYNDLHARSFNSVKYSKLADYHNRRNNNNNNNHHHHSQPRLIDALEYEKQKRQATVNLPPMITTQQALSLSNVGVANHDQQIAIRPHDLHKASTLLDSSNSHHNNVFQVVVMRVSLHCQGCAGKLKKHLSKMEGVTSFSIELEHKRVTVMGHVSPLAVLENISRVRRAEFWPTQAFTD